jgi:anti-sigma factor RsiW
MRHEDDTPLSDEELALAKKGEALIAAAVADTEAPQSLREAIERDRERAKEAPKASFWRRHLRALTATATAAAALVVVGVAIQSGTESAAPTLAEVQATARLDATQPAPGPKGGTPPVLTAQVGAISFPDWQKSFGWRAVGAREDEISGRTVKTVFYRNPDRARLGYSVVAGEPLREHPPGREVTRVGNAYHVARAGGHTLVTWTQQGHTCVIVASSTIPRARLVDLAASRNS